MKEKIIYKVADIDKYFTSKKDAISALYESIYEPNEKIEELYKICVIEYSLENVNAGIKHYTRRLNKINPDDTFYKEKIESTKRHIAQYMKMKKILTK